MRKVRLLTILTLGVFSLSACNDGVGLMRLGCPELRDYSVAEQKAAASEIRKDPNSQLAKMVSDYGKLRKACRL